MITTNTGAKKIEGTDNWRQIFDAHNSSVDAHDETQSDLDYIIKGNSSSVSIAAGKFVSVRGSTITGVTDGIYTAAKAIPASTTLDSSYFTAVTGGALNALSDQIGSIGKQLTNGSSEMDNYTYFYVVLRDPWVWGMDRIGVVFRKGYATNYPYIAKGDIMYYATFSLEYENKTINVSNGYSTATGSTQTNPTISAIYGIK